MPFVTQLNQIKKDNDYKGLVELIPYAKFIGVETSLIEQQLVCSLSFMEDNIGNPALPALHGGVIAGFMENAALLHLIWQVELINLPKIIDFSIDYLRPGKAMTTYSSCETIRLGRRVALCNITTWQADITKPIAHARGHFLLSENQPLLAD